MKLDLGEPKNRLLLAVAISIAIHEAAAGLVPQGLARPTPSTEVITRRAQPAHRAALDPVADAAAGARRGARSCGSNGSNAAPRRRCRLRKEPRKPRADPRSRSAASALTSSSRPVWDAAGSANAGAMVASARSAAGGGTAAGAGGAGVAPSGDTRSCGFVTFSDPHGSQYDSRTRGFWVDIRMAVRFSDGSTQSMILDYPWYYPSEAANPWSDQNLRDPNFPTRFQQPPSEKAAGEPPLVQYVMTHSTADGLTLLRDCPAPDPAPA